MDIFFEEILGILPPLKRESYRAGMHATFEDGVASSLQGGVFGDVASLSGRWRRKGVVLCTHTFWSFCWGMIWAIVCEVSCIASATVSLSLN